MIDNKERETQMVDRKYTSEATEIWEVDRLGGEEEYSVGQEEELIQRTWME